MRWTVWGLVALVVVSALVGGVFARGQMAGMGAGGPSATARLTPASGPPPTIFYFYASPSEILQTGSTTFFVGASGLGILSYVYSNLPTGCVSSDLSVLTCNPTGPGVFNVTVSITDGTTLATSTTYTVVYVDPVVTPNLFSINPSVVSNLNATDAACTSINSPPFYQNFCSPEAMSPTLLPLANGTVGLASGLFTNLTTNACGGAAAATTARVGFSISKNGGSTFGPAVSLGNDTCAYLDAIEPSFAVSGSSVYGTFVEENSSVLATNYGNRGADALGFVASTNNGTSFASVMTILTGGNLARPSLAVSGSNVYIAVENISSSSTPIAGGVLPISVELLASSNGGATWSGPYTLPGLNASADFSAMNPAVAVNATGAVSVAYATNRTCLQAGSGGTCAVYGDSIVVTTSTTSGVSWSTPSVAATGAAESLCYTGSCYPFFFESTPEITLAYAPNGVDLYVAYSAPYFQGLGGSADFNHTGLFVEETSNAGASWTGGAVSAPSGATSLRSFNPGLGVSASKVYVTWLEANESAGTSGLANSLSQWMATAPVAATLEWNTPNAFDIDSFISGGSVNATRTSFSGYSSSISFSATGTPLVAFSLPGIPTQTTVRSTHYYYVNTSFPTVLAVGSLAVPGTPGVITVDFHEQGLPAGLPWLFTLNGLSFPLRTSTIEVTNIPVGLPVLVGAYYQPGYWEVISTYFNASLTTFFVNQTVALGNPDTFSFEVWVGIEVATYPSGMGPWFKADPFGTQSIQLNVISEPFYSYIYGFYALEGTFVCTPICGYSINGFSEYESDLPYPLGFNYQYCPGSACPWNSPWYVPLGTELYLGVGLTYYEVAPSYFTGNGAGSYTGTLGGSCYFPGFECTLTSGDFTVLGPVNETLWLGNAPENLSANVTVGASGIPSSSQYHFTFDGTDDSAAATTTFAIDNVAAGAHTIGGIWASGALPGWEYFGSMNAPDPFVTPVLTGVVLDFTAYENISAPAGAVSFYAGAIAPGTLWSIDLNGTTYRSATPWINVTVHPGTYAWSPGDAISPTGDTGYVPTTASGNISVTPGSTVPVTYVPAYGVTVLATPGGAVSAGSASPANVIHLWAAASSQVTLSAAYSIGYSFEGWAGTGNAAYNGTIFSPTITVNGPITETASFLPLPNARFNLTFEETGLPANTWWTVNLDGAGYSAATTSLTVGGLYPWSTVPAGQYSLSVPVVYLNSTDLTRYVASTPPMLVGTNGSFTAPVPITYLAQEYVQLTVSGDGTAQATYQGAPAGAATWIPQGATVNLSAAPNPGDYFVGWQGTGTGSYTGPNATASLVAASPIGEVALFAPVVKPPTPTYTLTVNLETPLEAGTVWGVTFNGVGYSSSGPSLTIPNETAATYSVQVNVANGPSGTVQYRPTATDPVAFTVRANAPIDVSYTPYFWVAVTSSAGGTISPGSGWYQNNTPLYFVATANSGDSFQGWSGNGAGSYTGTNSTASVIVSGPFDELASFTSNSIGSSGTSVWSDPATWVGLGAVGLVVGIAAGFVVSRLAGRPESGARGGSTPAPRAAETGGRP